MQVVNKLYWKLIKRSKTLLILYHIVFLFLLPIMHSNSLLHSFQLSESDVQSVLKKRCSGNMQQIYSKTPLPNCDFNKVVSDFIEIALPHECSPVNLQHIFRTPFPKNTSRWMHLNFLGFNMSFTIHKWLVKLLLYLFLWFSHVIVCF